MAALVVLALAMGQVGQIMSLFVRSIQATTMAAASTNSVLAALEHVGGPSDVMPSSADKPRLKLGEKVFLFEDSLQSSAKPCVFDAIGRHCL